jgi:hypothetical protein
LPTELLFYGGVEVSGNKILLKDNDTRILLDFGKGFSRRVKYFEEYLIAADGEPTAAYPTTSQNLYYKISMIEVILWPNISA